MFWRFIHVTPRDRIFPMCLHLWPTLYCHKFLSLDAAKGPTLAHIPCCEWTMCTFLADVITFTHRPCATHLPGTRSYNEHIVQALRPGGVCSLVNPVYKADPRGDLYVQGAKRAINTASLHSQAFSHSFNSQLQAISLLHRQSMVHRGVNLPGVSEIRPYQSRLNHADIV